MHYRPPHPPVLSLFRALSAGTVQAPTPCPADDMCGSSPPPPRGQHPKPSSKRVNFITHPGGDRTHLFR
ncbi:hypothetical protein COCSADRAFT_34787 [Bipolaris sorokiniana ND90Pr]|uniref:Uncharacterized protein n=1 Tax=Cochliobolus sativus (strain ND90Pr / ATCC 201652) TaxID=665912 RepID=M2SV89_COCSN|nr:uncharacterized protein COCSADRAFT_34787 [Bipolaris sorokiniana ND90Pr]EMD66220.1 hypothetical protein COCSADRAFT_34787 [Bipolaris sorokiniana ND90Pr]